MPVTRRYVRREVARSAGIDGSEQAALDAKFDKAGGAITGRTTITHDGAAYALDVTNLDAGGSGIKIVTGATFQTLLQGGLEADTQPRLYVDSNGVFNWGAGGSSDQDVNLYRSAGDTLKTDDAFHVGATFRHLGSSLGFYNAAAVAKPNVTGSRGANAALASLLTALANLGLITDSSS